MARYEVKLSGFGGQGIIKSGYILGKAASIYNDLNATLTQSFGPEARGSACSAQVIISDEPILYPYITKPKYMACLSQEAYNKFEPELDENGILVIDDDLVTPKKPRGNIKLYKIPCTRMAEEMGRKIVLNIIMLGFFVAVTGLVDREAARKAVASSVPEKMIDFNEKAFDKGYEYGLKVLEAEKAEANK